MNMQTNPDVLAKMISDNHETTKGVLETISVKQDGVDTRLLELEQKMARGNGAGGPALSESWGAQVQRDPQVKALSDSFKGRIRFGVKAVITSATTDADGSAGDLIAPDRRPDVIMLPKRRLRVRDLFMPGETSSGSIEWPRQTGRTLNPATVAESNLKPQSDLKFDMQAWPVRTIAHWVLASRQILADVPALRSIIDGELLYGLSLVEENQFLNGAGTGTDLSGVYTTAAAFNPPFEAENATMIDVLLQAIAQVDNTDYDADGIVLHPLDWRKMQSLKDGQGRYLGGGPFGDLVARLWQLPIVPSKAMTQGKFLVGAFKAGAQIFDRQDANVEISTEDSDNFRKNLVTVLAEERLAFVVKHTDVFVKGDFTEALSL